MASAKARQGGRLPLEPVPGERFEGLFGERTGATKAILKFFQNWTIACRRETKHLNSPIDSLRKTNFSAVVDLGAVAKRMRNFEAIAA